MLQTTFFDCSHHNRYNYCKTKTKVCVKFCCIQSHRFLVKSTVNTSILIYFILQVKTILCVNYAGVWSLIKNYNVCKTKYFSFIFILTNFYISLVVMKNVFTAIMHLHLFFTNENVTRLYGYRATS